MIGFQWNINRICNFRCDFCFNYPNEKKFLGPDLETIEKAIARLTKDYFFSIDGGEPFLTPNFAKICGCITKRFHIGVYTNLSKPVDEFISQVNIENVDHVVASLHIKERDRLGLPFFQIIKEYNKLKKAGFKSILFRCIQTMIPI